MRQIWCNITVFIVVYKALDHFGYQRVKHYIIVKHQCVLSLVTSTYQLAVTYRSNNFSLLLLD